MSADPPRRPAVPWVAPYVEVRPAVAGCADRRPGTPPGECRPGAPGESQSGGLGTSSDRGPGTSGDRADRPAPAVEVRRSARRRSTVSAYRDGDRVVVLIPARFSRADEREWVGRMVERLERRERRSLPSDADLLSRAARLSRRHLPDHPGAACPASVRWVTNQNGRWGSCTPADRTIRLSTRLRGMPGWVIDYVLMHELCHLVIIGHGSDFWDLVGRYPRSERARGYLEGVAAAAGLDISEDGVDVG